jgi:hypothetical protein
MDERRDMNELKITGWLVIVGRVRSIVSTLLFSLIVSSAQLAHASEDFRALDEETQSLKNSVLDLNRELSLLEEEMLYPGNSQVAVFVSMDVGEFFDLDSVELTLDGKNISNHLYTQGEVIALHRGGVHKIYLGNLRSGDHELVAIFTGVGPHGRDYRRGAQLNFDKVMGSKYVELVISDNAQKLQPEFIVREWD